MKLVNDLGLPLKAAAVIELFEAPDGEVVYHFDRRGGNPPGSWSSAAGPAGIQLRFDAMQRPSTLRCYWQPRGRFAGVGAPDHRLASARVVGRGAGSG